MVRQHTVNRSIGISRRARHAGSSSAGACRVASATNHHRWSSAPTAPFQRLANQMSTLALPALHWSITSTCPRDPLQASFSFWSPSRGLQHVAYESLPISTVRNADQPCCFSRLGFPPSREMGTSRQADPVLISREPKIDPEQAGPMRNDLWSPYWDPTVLRYVTPQSSMSNLVPSRALYAGNMIYFPFIINHGHFLGHHRLRRSFSGLTSVTSRASKWESQHPLGAQVAIFVCLLLMLCLFSNPRFTVDVASATDRPSSPCASLVIARDTLDGPLSDTSVPCCQPRPSGSTAHSCVALLRRP